MKPELWYLFMTIVAMLLSCLIGASPNMRDRSENVKLKIENARLKKRIEEADRILKAGE